MVPTKKIGLTYTGFDEKHNIYVQWLMAGEDIEIITLSAQEANLQIVKDLDGIVLSGGVDVQPKYYNSDVIDYTNAPASFNEKRDVFEKAVFEISQQNNIPLLAVCRGLQLVNCLLGGTLVQDIGAANLIHKVENKLDKAHGINITAGTLLNEIMNVERTMTNSAHHQAINKIGDGLLINCMADDGIIEGIEWADKKEKAFFLGIQWHPERMYKFNLSHAPSAKNIRDRFINEVKKSTKKTV